MLKSNNNSVRCHWYVHWKTCCRLSQNSYQNLPYGGLRL